MIAAITPRRPDIIGFPLVMTVAPGDVPRFMQSFMHHGMVNGNGMGDASGDPARGIAGIGQRMAQTLRATHDGKTPHAGSK